MVHWTQDLMAGIPPGKRSHVGDSRHESCGAVHTFPLESNVPVGHPNIKLVDSEGNGLLHIGVWNERGHRNVST